MATRSGQYAFDFRVQLSITALQGYGTYIPVFWIVGVGDIDIIVIYVILGMRIRVRKIEEQY